MVASSSCCWRGSTHIRTPSIFRVFTASLYSSNGTTTYAGFPSSITTTPLVIDFNILEMSLNIYQLKIYKVRNVYNVGSCFRLNDCLFYLPRNNVFSDILRNLVIMGEFHRK